MAIIRWVLGRIILLLNFIFSPSGTKRSAEEQQKLDEKTQNLALYQLKPALFVSKFVVQSNEIALISN